MVGMKRTIFRPAANYGRWFGIFLFLGAMFSAKAQTVIWEGDAPSSNFWGVAGNWSTGSVPTSSDDLIFNGAASEFSVFLGGTDREANSVTFDSATAFSITDEVGGITLTTGDISVLQGNHSISADFNLLDADSTIFDIASGTGLTIAGTLGNYSGGSGGLTKNGTGTLTLSAHGTFTGDTVVNAGVVSVKGDTSPLQNSMVEVNVDGGLALLNGEHRIGSLSGSGDITGSGTLDLIVGGNNASTTYSGNIVGQSSLYLTKAGSGTWTFTSDDLNMDDLDIASGTIVLDAATATIARVLGLSGKLTVQNGPSSRSRTTCATARSPSVAPARVRRLRVWKWSTPPWSRREATW